MTDLRRLGDDDFKREARRRGLVVVRLDDDPAQPVRCEDLVIVKGETLDYLAHCIGVEVSAVDFCEWLSGRPCPAVQRALLGVTWPPNSECKDCCGYGEWLTVGEGGIGPAPENLTRCSRCTASSWMALHGVQGWPLAHECKACQGTGVAP